MDVIGPIPLNSYTEPFIPKWYTQFHKPLICRMVCRFAIRRQNDHKLSVPYYIPSGKRLQNYRKSTISTAIFNSYVTNYRRVLFMMMVSSCFITIAWWSCTVTVRFVGDLFLDKPSLHVSLRPCRVREDLPSKHMVIFKVYAQGMVNATVSLLDPIRSPNRH